MHTITIKIDSVAYQRLRAIAQDQGRSLAQVTREALAASLEYEPHEIFLKAQAFRLRTQAEREAEPASVAAKVNF